MNPYVKNLGKVRPTTEGDHDIAKEYDILSIVTVGSSSYISRKVVPVGTSINNKEYWQLLVKGGTNDNNNPDIDNEQLEQIINDIRNQSIALTRHIEDNNVHTTNEEKNKWNNGIVTDEERNKWNQGVGGESYTADEEDITLTQNADSTGQVYQFKNRDTSKGMGYVILRSNKTLAEQVTKENTIYEIRYDFDLDGAEINVPECCVLDFKGGSFSNGTIIGNKTIFLSYPEYSIFNDCFVKGFRWQYIDIRWFGAKEGEDCSDALQRAVNTYDTMILTPIKIIGEYRLDKTVKADNGIIIDNNVTNSYFRDDRLYEGHATSPMGKLIVENPITCINTERINVSIYTPAQEAVISIVGLYVVNEAKNATFLRYRCGGWPTGHHIIKHNRFEGFDKVLYFAGGEAPSNSQAFAMTIDHTDFTNGNYAIYAVPENPDVADASFTNMVMSNCRLNNGSKLYIKGLYGSNTIKDTTVEGTTIEGTQIDTPILYLGVRTGNLTFENMYLENIDGYIYIEGTNERFDSFYSEVNFRGNYYMWDSYANPKLKYYLKNIRISSLSYNLPNNNLLLDNASITDSVINNNAYNPLNLKNLNIDGVQNSILVSGMKFGTVSLDSYSDYGDGGTPIITGYFSRTADFVLNIADAITCYQFTSTTPKVLDYNTFSDLTSIPAGNYCFTLYKGLGVLKIEIYDGEELIKTLEPTFGCGVCILKCTIENEIVNPSIKMTFTPRFTSSCYCTGICVIPIKSEIGYEEETLKDFLYVLGDNGGKSSIRHGFQSQVPKLTSKISASTYYDRTNKLPIWWDGYNWREADGEIHRILRKGTWAKKPELPAVGFRYFCTDKQTAEGATNGIVIYHKGENVWVDALGRVIE